MSGRIHDQRKTLLRKYLKFYRKEHFCMTGETVWKVVKAAGTIVVTILTESVEVLNDILKNRKTK